jgi:hypothetical protein
MADSAQLEKMIISELSKHRNPNDIIPVICEQYSLNWPEAQAIVERVRAARRSEINKKDNNLSLIFGFIMIIAGILLSLTILFLTLDGVIIFILRLPIPYLGNLAFFLLGIFIAAGGWIGRSQAMKNRKMQN